jgi:hypothetical protein
MRIQKRIQKKWEEKALRICARKELRLVRGHRCE